MIDACDAIEPGDVLLHNDPFEGADHQSDVVVAVPVFVEDVLVGFSVNRGHWSDIGAMFAGGYGLASHTVQEGLVIPTCKLMRRGVVAREIKDFILRNVRMPRQVWGDLQAQLASAYVAADRIRELVARHGLAQVQDAVEHSLDYAARRFRERLALLPDGVFEAEDAMDDDGFGRGPFPVRVRVTKAGDRVTVDFAGTAAQTDGAANCSLGATKAAVYTALKALVDPDIPYNSAVAGLIEIRAPEGTIVNPRRPAPVCCSPADPTNRIFETVMRSWLEAVPERVVVGGYSSGLNAPGWGRTADGQEFMWYVLGPGGCGARAERDGLTAQWHTMSMCGTESVEAWEARYPVRFERRALRPDSAGAGRRRGGLGDERVIELLADTQVSGFLDRFDSEPWGAEGGAPGSSNAFRVGRDGRELRMTELGLTSDGKFTNLPLRAGDRFIVRSGGGGGMGDPFEREPARVAADVLAGYVSRAAALAEYGVVLDADGRVDEAATALRRGAAPTATTGAP
jgi:N-methylhydantoinase B/oxoprolinase/acetone carboxylase alpha subunit